MIAKMIRPEPGAKGRGQVFKIRDRQTQFDAGLNELVSPDRRPIRRLDFGKRMVCEVGNRLRTAFRSLANVFSACR